MTTAAENLAQRLRAIGKVLADTVDEHLEDYEGELLLHILIEDTLRISVEAFRDGDTALTAAVGKVVAAAYETGDEYVRNAVEVSFVEPAWDAPPDFIAAWPQVLQDELKSQHGSP